MGVLSPIRSMVEEPGLIFRFRERWQKKISLIHWIQFWEEVLESRFYPRFLQLFCGRDGWRIL